MKEIRKDLLYPFFDQGGSDGIGDYQKDIHDSTPQIHKNFNFQLPFFGFRLNYTRVRLIFFHKQLCKKCILIKLHISFKLFDETILSGTISWVFLG